MEEGAVAHKQIQEQLNNTNHQLWRKCFWNSVLYAMVLNSLCYSFSIAFQTICHYVVANYFVISANDILAPLNATIWFRRDIFLAPLTQIEVNINSLV